MTDDNDKEPPLYSAEWFRWVEGRYLETDYDEKRDQAGDAALNLQRAVGIATEAHRGQTDSAGADYILHPLRVAEGVSTADEKIVAMLHDVVEDCPGWTFERLEAEGFSATVIEALRLVTKVEGDSYEDFVRRAGGNPIARAVKIADLRDNMDLTRLREITGKDMERIEKYRRALKILGG